jgi:hypothetical protein
VSFYAWILALHLIAAFAVASSLVLFSALVYSGRRMTTLEQTRTLFRLAPTGNVLITAGIGLVFALGVILALDSGTFEIWDGWVIAGIVLWALLGGVGQRSGAYYMSIQELAEQPAGGNEAEVLRRLKASRGALLHVATVSIFLLILLDMIFKPGA